MEDGSPRRRDPEPVAEEAMEEAAAVVVVAEAAEAVDEDHKCAGSLPAPGDVDLVIAVAFLMANVVAIKSSQSESPE